MKRAKPVGREDAGALQQGSVPGADGADGRFRLATAEDLSAVADVYTRIVTGEYGKRFTAWREGVYPTRQTAMDAYDKQELFVYETAGRVAAAARISREQEAAYRLVRWAYDAPEGQIMVLRTLVVDPCVSGRGYGRGFVRFYEDYATKHGCPYLRMDTNALNTPARSLYRKLGYREAAILPWTFPGRGSVHLVCLEKKLPETL